VDVVILWARAIVPGLCVAAAALPLLRFGLPEHAHARILEALASRRG
jgi:Na+/melibiose symporter-like transporter